MLALCVSHGFFKASIVIPFVYKHVRCQAEDPLRCGEAAIAKAVAHHLGGGRVTTVCLAPDCAEAQLTDLQEHIRGNQFVKNYNFDFTFRQWGPCSVTMTSVLGHLTSVDFDPRYKAWNSCPPSQLFEAPTHQTVATVGCPETTR